MKSSKKLQISSHLLFVYINNQKNHVDFHRTLAAPCCSSKSQLTIKSEMVYITIPNPRCMWLNIQL